MELLPSTDRNRGLILLIITSVTLIIVSKFNYLLFHSLAEIISIVIGISILVISRNTLTVRKDSSLDVLGIGYASVALLDFIHLLSYKGMNVFPDYDYYAAQIWIVARYLESFTLFVAILTIITKKKISNMLIVIVAIMIISGFLYLIIGNKSFPICFIEGSGQTVFKVFNEYVIIAMFSLSLLLFQWKKQLFPSIVWKSMSYAILYSILAEFSFTLYIDFYGLPNMAGHILKIVSFYYIYRGLIDSSLRSPYLSLFNEIESRNQELDTLINTIQNGVVVIDASTHQIKKVNQTAIEMIGLPKEEVIGKLCHNFICPNEQGNCPIKDRHLTVDNAECVLLSQNRGTVPILKTVQTAVIGNEDVYIESFTDITALKNVEAEKERIISELQEALEKIKVMRGLLPICSCCKKIRDDSGYWSQVEEYIHEHSDVQFSHSICPNCSEKLYGDEDWYKEMKEKNDSEQ